MNAAQGWEQEMSGLAREGGRSDRLQQVTTERSHLLEGGESGSTRQLKRFFSEGGGDRRIWGLRRGGAEGGHRMVRTWGEKKKKKQSGFYFLVGNAALGQRGKNTQKVRKETN